MTLFEIVNLGVNFFGLAGLPFVALMLTRQDRNRVAQFSSVSERFTSIANQVLHLDGCIDDIKVRMFGTMVTRADLAAHLVEVRDMIDRHAARTAQDTNGLHQRIMRLENHLFTGENRG